MFYIKIFFIFIEKWNFHIKIQSKFCVIDDCKPLHSRYFNSSILEKVAVYSVALCSVALCSVAQCSVAPCSVFCCSVICCSVAVCREQLVSPAEEPSPLCRIAWLCYKQADSVGCNFLVARVYPNVTTLVLSVGNILNISRRQCSVLSWVNLSLILCSGDVWRYFPRFYGNQYEIEANITYLCYFL